MSRTAPLSARLRSETRAEHAALEARLPISGAAPDARIYREHLRFLLGFHEPLEARLRRVPGLAEVVPNLDARWKSARLRQDLGRFADGPRAAPELLPAVDSLPRALGALYVLEGATLGARALEPSLRASGVIPGEVGSAYLSGYDTDSPRMWRRFQAALDGVSDSLAPEVVASARETFTALGAWHAEIAATR